MKLFFPIIFCLLSFHSISQLPDGREVKIYPNPSTSEITIEGFSYDSDKLLIYDMEGKSVLDKIKILHSSESKITLDISALNKGVYYFKINSVINKVFKE